MTDEGGIPAELIAKDKRIDDLVAQAEKLVADLNDTVTDMKAILVAAGRNVAAQQEMTAEERRDRPRG
jgi:ABC-type transporter Mla subunit MlaD